MGGVALLQYHHGVSDMPVPEVYPHGRLGRRPATTPINWSGPQTYLLRKFHPERSGSVAPAFLVALLPPTPFCHSVVGLAVRSQ